MLPTGLDQREAWVVGESVRRTIVIASVLIHVASALTKGGFVLQPFLLALPFDARTTVFPNPEAASKDDLKMTKIVSYREFTEEVLKGNIVGVDAFGAILLSACKGYDRAKTLCCGV